jgi:hypothetical protein
MDPDGTFRRDVQTGRSLNFAAGKLGSAPRLPPSVILPDLAITETIDEMIV